VIGKVCRRGKDVRRLLYYLFTEGLAGEHGLDSDHTDARLVGGWDDPTVLEPPLNADGRRDLRRFAGLLNAPLALAGLGADATPVYHLAISAAKDPDTGQLRDRLLSDAEWADVAAEYLDRIGLAPRGDADGVRWVAVRHADDHIHVVATLARQDGKRVWPYRDFLRSREASHAVEARYGLTSTAPADRTGTPETTRGEHRRLARLNASLAEQGRPGQPAPDREVLRRRVRTALAGSNDLPEFIERLRGDGVLVRERFSIHDPEQITGYAVALPHYSDGGTPIWFGGGKLAPDLTLPQLQRRWQDLQAGEGTAEQGTGKGQTGAGKTAGKGPAVTTNPRAGSTGRGRGPVMDPDERARIWAKASAAAQDAESALRAAAEQASQSSPEGGADGGGGGMDDVVDAAADMMAGAARVGDRKARHGHVTDAAEAFDRAARTGRTGRRGRSGTAFRLHGAARRLLDLHTAMPRETKQLLILLEQLRRMALAIEQLRAAQGRAAQAAGARTAEEALLAELTRRTGPSPRSTAPPTPRPAEPVFSQPYRPPTARPRARGL
jgi:hypothetical protein